MINSKKGFCLIYVIFIFVLIINILIFLFIYSLNRNNYLIDKDKYYHVFVFEERVKKHIKERFMVNEPDNNETELLNYDDDFIYLLYQYDFEKEIWCISYRIKYQEIDQFGIIYYNTFTDNIIIEIQ